MLCLQISQPRSVDCEKYIVQRCVVVISIRWLSAHMMTSSNGNIFRVTGFLCWEFIGRRWIPLTKEVTQSYNVFFDLRLNKRFSKQSRCWWFKTPSRSLWRRCNANGASPFLTHWRYYSFALNHRIVLLGILYGILIPVPYVGLNSTGVIVSLMHTSMAKCKDCSNSSALEIELWQSFTEPSKYSVLFYIYIYISCNS